MSDTTHSIKAIQWIGIQLRKVGIADFRFCKENDCYVCDINGNFFSVCKRQYSKSGSYVERYGLQKLEGSIDKYGYRTYRITVNGVKKHLKAHRMMLNAWIGEQPELVVNHKDGNKQNNALDNLEWCTVAENNAHAIKTGLFDPYARRNFHYSVNFADWMTVYILYKHCGFSYCKLGRIYRCKHDTIKRIVQRIDSIMPEEVKNGK